MDYWVIVFIITTGYLVLSLLIGLLSGRKTSANPESYVAGTEQSDFSFCTSSWVHLFSAPSRFSAGPVGLTQEVRRPSILFPTQ